MQEREEAHWTLSSETVMMGKDTSRKSTAKRAECAVVGLNVGDANGAGGGVGVGALVTWLALQITGWDVAS